MQNTQELRLECLRIATVNNPQAPAEKLVKEAIFLEEYLLGNSRLQPCSTDDKE